MTKQTSKIKLEKTIFEDLFSDKKYLLRLYMDLYPGDKKVTEDDLENVTFVHVFNGDVNNYLGFKIDNRLILILSQAIWTNDITYHALNLMSDMNKLLKWRIVWPEMYLIYVGDREEVPEKVSFSEEYFGGKKIAYDFSLRVLNKPEDKTIFGQYIFFCKKFNEQKQLFEDSNVAISNTLDICKKNNILTEYIESREQEVREIMAKIVYQEDAMRLHDNKIKYEEAREIAENLIKENISLEIIEKCSKSLSMDDLKEIEAEVNANGDNK